MTNLEFRTWVPEDVKQQYADKWKEKKTGISAKQLENLFRKILDEYGIKPAKLKVKDGQTGLFEITSYDDKHTNMELVYNKHALPYYDKDEIEAMLYHEAFHPLTMQSGSMIPVRPAPRELMDYLTDFTVVYEEYVNYAEQLQHYEKSSAMLSVKLKEIPNYSIMFYDIKYAISLGRLPHALFPHNVLIKVLSDAIYFRILHKEVLDDWAEKNKANAILRFYDWIVQDFKEIHSYKPNAEEIFTLTQLTGQLSVSVETTEMILGNRIEFTPEAYDVYNSCLNAMASKPKENKMAQAWMDRFSSTYS